jgi:hypothetical protein
MASKSEEIDEKSSNKTPVTEYNVTLFVDKYAASPKKSEVFYDKETTLNRLCNF